MTPDERDALIEASITAYRDRDAEGRPVPPPAWWDLAPEDLDRLYVAQREARALERALDSNGLSSTVRAVLRRMSGL